MKLEEFMFEIKKILDCEEEKLEIIKSLGNEIVNRTKNLKDINDRKLNIVEGIFNSKRQELINFLFLSRDKQKEEDINNFESTLRDILDEFKRLEYLNILGEKNTVIVGGNGSGKSSLVSFLKESDSEKIIVIPAQKIMFFKKSELVTRQKIQEEQKINLNEKTLNSIYDINNRINGISNLFTNHIVAAVKSHVEVSLEYYESEGGNKRKSAYTKLCNIWEKLYREIKLKIDPNHFSLIPVKNGEKYDINLMSEGEKVVILYILIVLFAPENSYIIIDEPETFLNPSIYNRLWNLLENERNDCTFIYVSHNINFINSRNIEYYYWCKKYNGNYSWEINKVKSSKENNIPKALMIELMGVTKPILFCEGDESALDYIVYNSLFENNVIVKPVGGHRQVIEYTKAYNNIDIFTNKAIGIIDKDYHSLKKLEKLQENKIYHLQVNEIESLLIVEDVLECVLNNTYPEEKEVLKTNFINKCMEYVEKKREDIVRSFIKHLIDERITELDTEKIKKDFSIIDIREYYTSILYDEGIDEKIEEFQSKLTYLFEEKEYEKYLEYASYKYLLYQIAQREFNMDYRTISINRIKVDENLRRKIREKYFEKLTVELLG